MVNRYQGGILGVGFNPLQAPNAPTIGTATATSITTVSVAFTAPANVGGSAITSYVVQSTPGGIVATGSSSPITVSGLTTNTTYTFRVTALNSYGPSPASAPSNSATPAVAPGQQAFTTPGTFTWVAPENVTSVSVVAVGGGKGASWFGGFGGGGLGWRNNISVTPGTSYTITVGAGSSGITGFAYPAAGGCSTASLSAVVTGGGAPGGSSNSGGSFVGQGGGNGGPSLSSGGGGAGGYSGQGGTGGAYAANAIGTAGTAGTGGAGGGGGGTGYTNDGYTETHYTSGAGGGVGLLGEGSNGSGGIAKAPNTNNTGSPGGGGSGGASGATAASASSVGGAGGLYGGAGGIGSGSYVYGADPPYTQNVQAGGKGGDGAVRIIWPGTTRSFPSTNTGNL